MVVLRTDAKGRMGVALYSGNAAAARVSAPGVRWLSGSATWRKLRIEMLKGLEETKREGKPRNLEIQQNYLGPLDYKASF